MRLTLCARFAIFLAILLTNTEALTMTEDKAQAKDEAPDNTASAQTALTSLLKDTKNVKRQDFLLNHDPLRWPFFLFFENFESMQRNSKTRASEPAETSAIESSSKSGFSGHIIRVP